MPAARRIELNQRVLAALLDRDGADLAAIVHHAAEAGDAAAVARYAPRAADEATAAGSHREAAAYLRLALGHRSAYRVAEQADLLDRYAVECYINGDHRPALAAQLEAVELRRTLGDPPCAGCQPAMAVADPVVAGAPVGRRTGRRRSDRGAGGRR